MEIPPLTDAIAALKNELTKYPVSIETYIPDHALFNLAIDVIEHAKAVHLLLTSEVPRAAHANARGAMEASQDLVYLTASSREYEHRGCLARVFEVQEAAELQQRFNKACELAGLPAMLAQSADAVLDEDERQWESHAPGCGSKLRAAREELRADKNRRRHWSGLSRHNLAKSLERILGAESGFGEFESALYGAMSVYSHPRPRATQREVTVHDDGFATFRARLSELETAGELAALACVRAIHALRERKGFDLAA